MITNIIIQNEDRDNCSRNNIDCKTTQSSNPHRNSTIIDKLKKKNLNVNKAAFKLPSNNSNMGSGQNSMTRGFSNATTCKN